jgi:hypothetical protein
MRRAVSKSKRLPPGEYKVFALEGFEKDAWLDPRLSSSLIENTRITPL